MRRNDTSDIGRQAEDLAAQLLKDRNFNVRNLNDEKANYLLYDLVAECKGVEILVSVKCARAKRDFRLGRPSMLSKLHSESVIMVFLPVKKGEEIRFIAGGYDLLILPASIARDEALEAHFHYAKTHPGSADHSVMVKDKIDRSPSTRSGAVFKRWNERYLNAWNVFENLLQ